VLIRFPAQLVRAVGGADLTATENSHDPDPPWIGR
jgi:hypothetical protein